MKILTKKKQNEILDRLISVHLSMLSFYTETQDSDDAVRHESMNLANVIWDICGPAGIQKAKKAIDEEDQKIKQQIEELKKERTDGKV